MKKILILVVVFGLMLSACSSQNVEDSNNVDNIEKQSGGIEVDKNLLAVEVTYPASLVGDDKESLLYSKEDGIKEVRENEDGSITFVMTKAKYNEMMEEAKKQAIEFFDSIIASGNYKSIKKVTYNDNFTEVILEVDKEAYQNSFDGVVTIGIAFSCGFYKVFETGPDFSISIKYKDASTGEVFNEVIFPGDFNNKE